MLVSNGTRVALKANPPSPVTEPPSPVTEPPGPTEKVTTSDPSTPSDPGAADPLPEPKKEVFKQQPHFRGPKLNLFDF